MKIDFATWSIRRPIPVILLFILLTVAGLIGLAWLPVADMPDLDLPTIRITLTRPGVAPAQMETEVARKVEDAVSTLAGLRHIRTAINDGRAEVTAEFEIGKNLSDALIETRDAVEGIRGTLPDDIDPPQVSAVRVGSSSILTYAVDWEGMDAEALSWFVDDTVSKALLAVPGVGKFERIGGVQREVQVRIDPLRLYASGATVSDISQALRSMQQENSGGKLQLSGLEQSIRTSALVREAQDLRTLRVALADGRSLRLDEVADVADTVVKPAQAALLDGKPAVGFRIYRGRGVDETRVAADVARVLSGLAEGSPVRFSLISGTVAHTEEQYLGSMHMLWEGALLAVLVVWGFLRDWRATLVAASALPLSTLPAFAVMYWLGYSLNTLTLLALAAVIGILVDDAIVEIENIKRHAQMGKSPFDAASDAVREIALAVIATTSTLAVVFAPTALMGGVPGLFFKQFGWTAVIAVLSSLLVARLLTPMMSAWFLKPAAPAAKDDGPLMKAYLRMVGWTLRHRGTTLVLSVVVFAISVAPLLLLRTGLIPASDQGYTTVDIELPPGCTLAMTIERAEAARRAISGVRGIRRVFAVIGAGSDSGGRGARSGEVTRGSLILDLVPREMRGAQSEVEAMLRQSLQEIPGARFTIAGGMGAKLSLILASEDAAALMRTSEQLVRELRGVGSLVNITSTAGLERPELVIRPDTPRAAELGVSTAALGETVRIATAGDFDAQLPRLNLDTRQIYVRAMLPESALAAPDTLAQLQIRARNGMVPLGSVAALGVESGPSQIDRYDRRRYVTVSAELNGMSLGAALHEARNLPAVAGMPASVALIDSGDGEILHDLLRGFGMAMVAGLLCVYCVLVLLFEDFLLPLTILSAIPLSIGGAFFALWSMGAQLDVPAMIGLVMLMGIVTKNSILLVEYAVVGMRDRELSLSEAILDACHKRARPIVMTTVAMIAGMAPIALGFGADASFRQPMAVAVIGGLLSSTALSLLVVPVVFVVARGIEAILLPHRAVLHQRGAGAMQVERHR